MSEIKDEIQMSDENKDLISEKILILDTEKDDIRGIFNRIEDLVHNGKNEAAKKLFEFTKKPEIRQEIEKLAKKSDIEGGVKLAEQAAIEAIETIEGENK